MSIHENNSYFSKKWRSIINKIVKNKQRKREVYQDLRQNFNVSYFNSWKQLIRNSEITVIQVFFPSERNNINLRGKFTQNHISILLGPVTPFMHAWRELFEGTEFVLTYWSMMLGSVCCLSVGNLRVSWGQDNNVLITNSRTSQATPIQVTHSCDIGSS